MFRCPTFDIAFETVRGTPFAGKQSKTDLTKVRLIFVNTET
ncbi:hypothetical protein SAMN05443287_104487 [Micromonospora phaseoli]|uniref:Uncharacterized protein n=1 Tax=Micromonospora phaseoli TaxID=1144548 RepID=A0A1H6Z786_9ACTN|nr:hypothetical protein CLV64_103486 [Micromonospora phaseoli]SEJ45410.1 hypothetical protein SAMN05443287_104487 [Micromonospora phaseoli]